jgi:hypothetical protein
MECLSRMMGNYHVRFLGGAGAVRPTALSGNGQQLPAILIFMILPHGMRLTLPAHITPLLSAGMRVS